MRIGYAFNIVLLFVQQVTPKILIILTVEETLVWSHSYRYREEHYLMLTHAARARTGPEALCV